MANAAWLFLCFLLQLIDSLFATHSLHLLISSLYCPSLSVANKNQLGV
jgi:hypothetical protein